MSLHISEKTRKKRKNQINKIKKETDFIIEKYIKEEMQFLLSNAIVADIGTHLPISHSYQNIRKDKQQETIRE